MNHWFKSTPRNQRPLTLRWACVWLATDLQRFLNNLRGPGAGMNCVNMHEKSLGCICRPSSLPSFDFIWQFFYGKKIGLSVIANVMPKTLLVYTLSITIYILKHHCLQKMWCLQYFSTRVHLLERLQLSTKTWYKRTI